ncbi:synaptic vesicle glycoprotein 2C-like [Mizuhopecten yessoensis]|uniref:Synaptic vesicle glycoprotein 2C n=1 Tax=Mizuhopecten yessoensis TaxID=6573 RepID=A0A210Q2N4_MIZYE|nr:synaptic vesicle glycoprotein 2C-like [Mizuhopecten yessoensis]XP_021368893.1 synaptic vesicle glycoprotein 2C-like [Mizuhopecten yessoensis]XP_021368894.1 synaptic vesicle glycoprotein 2C-like [Mizuhopecten yessoensis]OWF42994.1 Synaptic vesicle glycoprotein 2C [Mizuhopecten yessoensis]
MMIEEGQQAEEQSHLIPRHHGNDNQYAVTYEEAISKTGYGKFHYLVLALCGWAVSSDAIEVLSISFVLPAAQCDLHLTSNDKGWLNSIMFVGMMLGGYGWGSLADHFGRRQVLLGSLTVNGLGALSSSFCQSFWIFLLMRLVSGIGVGGSIPVIFSYFTEFQPKEKRGTMISVLATFWMFGNIIAAGLAWIIVPLDIGYSSPNFTYNSWRIFIAICTFPSLSSAALFFLMPESPKFLLSVGKEEQAAAVLKKIYDINNPNALMPYDVESIVLSSDSKTDSHYRSNATKNIKGTCGSKSVTKLLDSTIELFRAPLRRSTIILLIVTFTISFGYYGLWMWFPELFSRVEKYGGSPCDSVKGSNVTESGDQNCTIPDTWTYQSGFLTALSNLPGNLFTIFLMDKIGRKGILVIGMLGSGVTVFFIPLIHNKVQNLLLSCTFGLISTLAWNALDVLQAELFPTGVRSTAMGVSSAANRIGAILGNLAFGELVDIHCSVPMIMVAVLLVLGGLTSLKLPNTTKTDIH